MTGEVLGRASLISALVILAFLLLSPLLSAQEIIEPRSGRLFLTITDLVLQAGPVNLRIQRSLDHRGSKQGLLGSRWQRNWESRLTRHEAFVLIEEGTVPATLAQDGDKPEHKNVLEEKLVFNRDGRAIRTKTDGTTETFDAQGRLALISTENNSPKI